MTDLVKHFLQYILFYVSTFIQSVQEAVNKQLINAANSTPSLRVAIVTFANDVSSTRE